VKRLIGRVQRGDRKKRQKNCRGDPVSTQTHKYPHGLSFPF
jgi:hypothetical protein